MGNARNRTRLSLQGELFSDKISDASENCPRIFKMTCKRGNGQNRETLGLHEMYERFDQTGVNNPKHNDCR